MTNWLKFFFGGFFVNKYAKQGGERGVSNAVLSLLLCFALFFAGLSAGHYVSFSTHCRNCSELTRTLDRVFSGDVYLHTENNKAISSVAGAEDNCTVIDTFTDPADAAKYSERGFGFILDTRPLETTYDDFSVTVTSKTDGSESEYEQYLSLSDSARSNYTVDAIYSGRALNVADGVEKYTAWLDGACDESSRYYNSGIADEYAAVKSEAVTDVRNNKLYELYVRSYYPDLVGRDDYAVAPTVRTWYVQNVFNVKDKGQYIAILDDTVIGNIVTDGGIAVDFNGFYFKTDGIAVKSGVSAEEFIVKAFQGASALYLNVYFINLLKITPLFVLVPVILSLILWGIAKALKSTGLQYFGSILKIVCALSWFSSLITFAVTFVMYYFVSRDIVFALLLPVFCIILSLRVFALALPTFVAEKRTTNNIAVSEV